MVNIILISHGVFCEGLLSSLKMIAGDDYSPEALKEMASYVKKNGLKIYGFTTIAETVDAYREKLGKALDETAGEDGTLVLADIMSGTPYQSAAYLSKTHKIGLVSGMNMPMLLSLALEITEEVTLEEAVKKAASQESWGINGTTFEKGEKKRRAKLSINKN